ncbi:MAG TPA: serine/threonine-protein kinase, partial [Chroococcales cyanobacterium]
MAELEITVTYKVAPARAVFSAMCVLFPLWSIIAPAALGFLIGSVISNPAGFTFATVLTWSLSLVAFILGCIAITAVSEDNRIHVSKDGIGVPLFLLPVMGFQRARGWTELRKADLISADSGKVLFLTFDSPRALPLKLDRFSNADVEQLLLAVELWATNCQRAPELIEYQTHVQNRDRGVQQVGYTQMWEEELSRRFQATAFIPLEPDKTLQRGRIKIVRQLAFGGLSAIYLAQADQRDMIVIKEAVVPPNADAETKAEAERHLTQEAQFLKRLDSPNIAKVLDYFVEDGRHYLVLEYINGQDLRQHVQQNGRLSQLTAIDWALSILEILSTLHEMQPPILHRDLTPENLVLAKDRIVLIDFGAANQFVGAATGTVVGKQAYIPPEQLRGKSVIESDLYAFG